MFVDEIRRTEYCRYCATHSTVAAEDAASDPASGSGGGGGGGGPVYDVICDFCCCELDTPCRLQIIRLEIIQLRNLACQVNMRWGTQDNFGAK